MFYFIADPHLGHRNVLRLCDRPFETIEEMNETIIQNWNSRVKNTDTVCIVGDMFFCCKEPEPILKRLHGKKRLILDVQGGLRKVFRFHRRFSSDLGRQALSDTLPLSDDVMEAPDAVIYDLRTYPRKHRYGLLALRKGER